MHRPVPGPLDLLSNLEDLSIFQRFERRLIQIGVELILVRLR